MLTNAAAMKRNKGMGEINDDVTRLLALLGTCVRAHVLIVQTHSHNIYYLYHLLKENETVFNSH